ncbi:Pol polyprotein, partial [Mucuna pruriens]
MWGLDIIGPIEPKASNGHKFILVAIDYFTKWVEAASYPSVTKSIMVKFIRRDIICRYDLPAHIITNNGTNLNNKMMIELYVQFKIKHHNSTPYRPKMNGVVEATNKNIKKIVQKMVSPSSGRIGGGGMDLELARSTQPDRREWTPNYEGPYVVKHAFSRGALILIDSNGQELKHLVNTDAVKLFYP